MNDPAVTISIVVAIYLTIASAIVVWRHGRELPKPTEPEPDDTTEAHGRPSADRHAGAAERHGHGAAHKRGRKAGGGDSADSDRRRLGRFLRLGLLYLAGLLVAGVVAAVAQPVIGPIIPNVMPADQHRIALAMSLGWSLVALNLVVAWHLVGALLPPEASGRPGPGTMGGRIGMLERALVVMLTLSGGPGSIGFVIAAKTLARFKELDDQDFAERYLLGTLASVTIALASALVAQQVWINAA